MLLQVWRALRRLKLTSTSERTSLISKLRSPIWTMITTSCLSIKISNFYPRKLWIQSIITALLLSPAPFSYDTKRPSSKTTHLLRGSRQSTNTWTWMSRWRRVIRSTLSIFEACLFFKWASRKSWPAEKSQPLLSFWLTLAAYTRASLCFPRSFGTCFYRVLRALNSTGPKRSSINSTELSQKTSFRQRRIQRIPRKSPLESSATPLNTPN